MLRWALKLYYDGRNFHGSQLQPGLRTVQGVLNDALRKAGYLNKQERVKLCCRTDSGVSALSQVAIFKSTKRPILGEINSLLPDDVIIWAHAQVTLDVPARKLIYLKHYRYYMPLEGKLDTDAIEHAIKFLIKRKEYGGLIKGKGRAEIIKIAFNVRNGILILDFYGKYFSRYLVRRASNALINIGYGKLSFEDFKEILKNKRGIRAAPPENLILYDVKTPLQFKVDLKYVNVILNKMYTLIMNLKTSLEMARDVSVFCRNLLNSQKY